MNTQYPPTTITEPTQVTSYYNLLQSVICLSTDEVKRYLFFTSATSADCRTLPDASFLINFPG